MIPFRAASVPLALLVGLTLVLSPAVAAGQHIALSQNGPAVDDVLSAEAKLTVHEAPLADALTHLSRRAGVRIVFSPSLLPPGLRVSCACETRTVREALDEMLRGTGLRYMAVGRQLIVEPAPRPRPVAASIRKVADAAPAPALSIMRSDARSSQLPVTRRTGGSIVGTVVSREAGTPLENAHVRVEGTPLGTLTRSDGRFVILNVPPGTYTITAQLIGYATASRENVRVATDESVTLELRLAVTAVPLEDIVVTGVVDPISGVRLPFSVGALSGDGLPVSSMHSPVAAIQGRIPGVAVVRSSGQPGTDVSIMLRTPTSIARSNAPMYVVDGVILGSTIDGPTLDIESMDIERIEVVKGAAAAALYGSRAAAGVIAITTARGRSLEPGTTRVTVRNEIGQSMRPPGVPLATHHAFRMDGQNRFVDEDGNPVTLPGDRVLTEDRVLNNPYPGQIFDNLREFYQPGLFNAASVTLAHNSAETNFHLGLSNYREKGTFVTNDGLHRYNLNLGLQHRLANGLSVSANLQHTRSTRDDLSANPFSTLLAYPPDVDLGARDEHGNYIQQPDATVPIENPIWRQSARENETTRSRSLLGTSLVYRPLGWLTFDGSLSYDRSDIADQTYVPKALPFPSGPEDTPTFTGGNLSLGNHFTETLNSAASARAIFGLGDLTWRITARALAEHEDQRFVWASATDFFVEDVPVLGMGQNVNNTSRDVHIRALGYFLQTGFDYDGRYIADLLVRRDGSSLFGSENRWNSYYRASVAYRMAEEAWWPLAGVTEFKPRFSIGTAGGRPGFLDRFETWTVLQTGAVRKTTLGNRNLGPEHTTERELGVDMILLDRYQVQLTYAHQVTRDQIIQIPQPGATGYGLQWQNAGEITGRTYEASLDAQLIQRPGLAWNAALVADRSRSEITGWDRSCFMIGIGQRCLGTNLSEMWGNRFFTSMAQLPDWLAAEQGALDINDDGYVVAVGAGGSWRDPQWGSTVDVAGRQLPWGHPILETDEDGNSLVERIGEAFPDLNMGLVNQVRWRGLRLHTHLHAQLGGDVYNQTRQELYNTLRHGDLDQTGKAAETVKPLDYYNTLYNTNNFTSHFVEDGTFLKLREAALHTDLPLASLDRIGIGRMGVSRIAVGVIGRNLFTWTGYTGSDPEVGSVMTRLDRFTWPNTRTLTANVEIVF